MNTPSENDPPGLPLFEPDTDATYTIEAVASLTGASAQTILRYREQGLISPVPGREADSAHEQQEDEQAEHDPSRRRLQRLLQRGAVQVVCKALGGPHPSLRPSW